MNKMTKRMKIINFITITVSVFVSVIAADAKTLRSSDRDMRFTEELNSSQIEIDTAAYAIYKKFPANRNGLVAQFYKKLISHKITEHPRQRFEGDTTQLADDLWVVKSGPFVINRMENNIYLTKQTDSIALLHTGDPFVPVCDFEHPIESLYNLLSVSSIPNNFTIDASLKINYVVGEAPFSCPLSQLIDFCLCQGCIPYISIESSNDEEIVALMVMDQPVFGFCHVFLITFDPNLLKSMSGTFSVKISSYLHSTWSGH